jgi:hypothetical protein
MTRIALQKLTGVLFILSAVGFAITSTVLSSTFNWPDILREPPDTVLTQFQDGGTSLVWTWFAVAWSYFLESGWRYAAAPSCRVRVVSFIFVPVGGKPLICWNSRLMVSSGQRG